MTDKIPVAVLGATALGRSVEVLKLKFWSVAVTMPFCMVVVIVLSAS